MLMNPTDWHEIYVTPKPNTVKLGYSKVLGPPVDSKIRRSEMIEPPNLHPDREQRVHGPYYRGRSRSPSRRR